MQNKENLKIGLLAFIAIGIVLNSFMLFSHNNGGGGTVQKQMPNKEAPKSNAAAGKANTSSSISPTSAKPGQDQAQKAKNNKSSEPERPTTSVEFEKYEHDFGKIQQKTDNKHTFSFTNTGENPLIIKKAKGSCGCTVPSYPKDPIPPGEKGDIDVNYKPTKRQTGNQTKTVTVTANTSPKQQVLKVKANVEKGS